jgi:glycosyltransferase involved in cell wall biosynthesis
VDTETPRVRVHVASWNTRLATELCVRSMRRTAVHPFELVVGDGGSTDGSVEMLERFARSGWLKVEQVEGGRSHAAWLDHWYATCPARYAIFSDSDVLYRRTGWLREMIERASSTGAAMVATRIQARDGVPFVHPITGARRTLAARPEPWLVLIDLAQTRDAVQTSFAYQDGAPADDDASRLGYDVGAAFFRDFEAAGLHCEEMGPEFADSYHHFGGLTWQRGGDTRMPLARRAKQVAKHARVRVALIRERRATR